MAKRLVKALGAIMTALLVMCLCAAPALAWPTSQSGRFELAIEDSSTNNRLFEGKELWAVDDNVIYGYYIEQAWQESGVAGTRGEPSYAADVFLADEGSDGATRYDLSSIFNTSLARTNATLTEYAGSSRDCYIECMTPMLFDETDYSFKELDYELKTVEDTVDGEPIEYYYFVFEGKLEDLMGIHILVTTIPFDEPIDVCVDYETGATHPYYGLAVEVAPHAYFEAIVEENGDAVNPMQFRSADGSDGLRFDATQGFKFVAPYDDGYIFDSVTYTVNGQEQVLEPTDETFYWDDGQEYPVYEVPPTAASVTIAVNVHEPAYTVNGDGTITFLEGDLPTAYKLDVVYGEGIEGIWIPDSIFEEGMRNAFVVETDEGCDYYCWPDKMSIFVFEMPEEYRVGGATLDPADAGEVDASIWDVRVRLDAPATMTVSALVPQYTYVDIDGETGVSVELTPEDYQALGLDEATFTVTRVTDEDELAKVDEAVVRGLEEMGEEIAPNTILAFDAWHVDAQGQPIDGSMTWSNTLRYGGYVTIPLPAGWTEENTLVYRYMEDDSEGELSTWINWIDATPSEDGTSFVVFADGSLGRYVLVSEAGVPQQDGWIQENGAWYYYKDGRMVVSDWVKWNGAWYYMSAGGKMLAGDWVKWNGGWYYLSANGKMVASDWVKWNGAWYYMAADGKMVANGWAKWNGAWYYLDKSGKMAASTWLQWNGKWYYLGADGKMVANGWVKYNGNYYYMNASGTPVVNGWINYGGKYYHFNNKGVCDRVA